MAKRVESKGSSVGRDNNIGENVSRDTEQNNNTSPSLLDLVKNYLYLCDDGGGSRGGVVDYATPVRFLLPDKRLGVAGSIVVGLLKAISFAYDLVTWFGYYWFQKKRPTQRLAAHREVKVSGE